MRMENVVDRIGRRFGSLYALAKALGFPQSTIYTWRRSGLVPAKHMTSVLRAGAELEPPLTAIEFLPREEREAAE